MYVCTYCNVNVYNICIRTVITYILTEDDIIFHSLCMICSIELCIEAQEYRVYPGTEDKVYNDTFFSRHDLVVNALDNLEARRYVDR